MKTMSESREPSASQSSASRARIQLGRRFRQVPHLLRTEGLAAVSDRIRRTAAEHLAPARAISPVRRADILAIDLSQPFLPPIPFAPPGQPLTVNWVITPPSPGSGGHTTLVRIVNYLEAHGYRNRIYFYDPYGGDQLYYESIVRSYYNFCGPVASFDHGMEDAHIVFATSWSTAYPIFNSRTAGKRFYFIQDFEPFFYPVGSTSSLAENTYRMGFHGISIGRSFAEKLRTEYGMAVDTFKFGCDLSLYQRAAFDPPRSGIVFYARRDNARRGLELGLMALELFASRRPDVEIHIYGDSIGKQPFRYTDHGCTTPAQLNQIYNRCRTGLCLSFTNVSLVPLEMLAAGCIPVVNDTPSARTDMPNPFIAYAPPYPQALCAQLEAVLANPDFDTLSSAAADSVRSVTWEEAGASVDLVLRDALREAAL
jgi:glycosyltransferase involved in cell wall biosynthesis